MDGPFSPEKRSLRSRGGRVRPSGLALLAALTAAALCLWIGLSRFPRLCPADYGQYEALLRSLGLTWTEADLARGELSDVRAITSVRYTRFRWASLLTPEAGNSLVYPVALVRLATEPFGLDLSVQALAFVMAALLALSTGLLSAALFRLLPRAWYLPGTILCLVYTDPSFCAVFRGLYPESAAIVFTLLYAAVSLQAWSAAGRRRVAWLLPVLLSSLLMLKATTPMLVFLPAVLAQDGWLLLSCRGNLRRPALCLAAAALLLFGGCRGAIEQALSDPDYSSDAAVYQTVFETMLPASDDPSALLEELGLDESYLSDVGRSYYEEESVYAHDPRNAREASVLFARLTPGRVLRTYLRHPGVLGRALKRLPVSLRDGFDNSRNRPLDGGSTAVRNNGWFAFVWRLLPLSWSGFLAVQLGLAAVCLLTALVRRRRVMLLGSLYALGGMLFLPAAVVFNGYAQIQELILFQVFLSVLQLAALCCLLAALLPVFRQWFTRYSSEPYFVLAPTGMEAQELPRMRPRALRRVPGMTRARLVLATAVFACLLLGMTFLPAEHPAGVNNGDFGRMMKQLDLTWPGYIYYDTEAQLGGMAVESYEYLQPFDPVKLTPLRPTYSLYWFASLVRLMTEPFGRPFSTLLLAWVMGLVSILCILRLVWDLYPVLGRWTAAAAFGLCAMLLCETYLTWYNSLYGEGCILLGLLLSLTCALHLALTPKLSGAKRVLWLLTLVLSLNVLLTAKAQMLLALPGALALLLVLGWHQRPYRYDLQVLHGLLCCAFCVLLTLSSVLVYRSDRTENSVSQRHTMWQAYFYGIFMISDDPIGDMQELGVDTAMAPDIGKFVDFGSDAYVYAPLSEEAREAFYDHVSMGTIVRWYLRHPGKLWQMLDHAARESQTLYDDFRVYLGQNYSSLTRDVVNGRSFWPGWRASLSPGSFLGYILYYGLLLARLLRAMLRRGADSRTRLLCCLPLFLLVTGVLQFPLSVLGNGFADNQKQLFCFSLCQDFLLLGTLVFGLHALAAPRKTEREGTDL